MTKLLPRPSSATVLRDDDSCGFLICDLFGGVFALYVWECLLAFQQQCWDLSSSPHAFPASLVSILKSGLGLAWSCLVLMVVEKDGV